MSKNLIKILSMATTVAGLVLTVISNWVSEKNNQIEIKEQVAEQLKAMQGGQ